MMYAIYDEIGRIVKSVDCPADKIERQLKEGQGYIETDAHDGTHYVKDGELITYPDRPSDDHGFDFILEQWVDTKTDEIRAQEALGVLRRERNIKLAMSDWTQMPDSPLSQEQRQAWAEYRQALRDLPQSNLDLDAVKWPQQPEV
jgi:hypothetical protein